MKSSGTVPALLAAGLTLAGAMPAASQATSVVGTVHNLSAGGPGEIKSAVETEVCKFCHIPHNTVAPVPLWGHALSQETYYRVPELSRGPGRKEEAPQPDGASRLCLSCHDGTVALGDVAGQSRQIAMAGAQYLMRGRRGFRGTDLSGSHPISFVVPDPGGETLGGGADMGVKPRGAIGADPDVRLDEHGKMQCTTCHDPHQDRFFRPDQVPHFWVKPTVDEVCLTCHELR